MLLPAINDYINMMKFLLQVFTAIQDDADAIKSKAMSMKGKIPKRCEILFNNLKDNADKLKKVSKELVCFYKVAES